MMWNEYLCILKTKTNEKVYFNITDNAIVNLL